MIDLYLEKYNGEMFFDISDIESDNEYLSFVFKATYNNKVIGAKITIPVVIKRSFFKGTKLLRDSGSLTISSIGEESDNFICALEELFKPDYKSTRKFTYEPEPIDYVVLNRGLYEFAEDKIYIKLCNNDDQSDFEEDEKINLELNFSFNLSTNRASLVEVKDGYSADLIAILMK